MAGSLAQFRAGEQGAMDMQHQISVITLGIADQARSKRFYGDGFGWTPVFENEEIVFFQMNGLVLGLWLKPALEEDAQSGERPVSGAMALAHNVASPDAVDAVLDQLAAAGGRITRPGDAPPHGGYRGYVEDPDGHLWEIAWNPAWPIDEDGHVTFAM